MLKELLHHGSLTLCVSGSGNDPPAGRLSGGPEEQFLSGTQPLPSLQQPAASTPDLNAAPAPRTHLAPSDVPRCQTSITTREIKGANLGFLSRFLLLCYIMSCSCSQKCEECKHCNDVITVLLVIINWNLVTDMGVLPVVDDLLHVVERVEQEVITPFNPVNGHGAILVHTGRESYTRKLEHMQPSAINRSLVASSIPL